MEASKAQPKHHASQIAVSKPQAHTRVFLFHFLFERKKNSHRKRNRMKDPYWQLLPRGSTLRFIYLCILRHRQFLSLWNAPQIGNMANGHSKQWKDNFKKHISIIVSFHKNLQLSSLQQDEAFSSRVFWNWLLGLALCICVCVCMCGGVGLIFFNLYCWNTMFPSFAPITRLYQVPTQKVTESLLGDTWGPNYFPNKTTVLTFVWKMQKQWQAKQLW